MIFSVLSIASLLFFSNPLEAAISPTKNSVPPIEKRKYTEVSQEALRLPVDHALKVIRGHSKLIDELEAIAFDTSENMDQRWKAFGLVVKTQKENSWPIVERGLSSSEWFMKQISLISIGEYHKDRIPTVVPKYLSEKAMVIRSTVVSLLETQVGRQEIRDYLWAELNHERNFRMGKSLWVRGQILGVLAKDPVRTELSQFAKVLQEKDQAMSTQALKSMEYLAGKKLGNTNDTLDKKVKLWSQWTKSAEFKNFERSSF